MMDWTGGAWPVMGLGWIFMVLVWVLVVVGIVALVRWLGMSSGERRKEADKTALEILRERYARGEIERDEYEQKRRDLEK